MSWPLFLIQKRQPNRASKLNAWVCYSELAAIVSEGSKLRILTKIEISLYTASYNYHLSPPPFRHVMPMKSNFTFCLAAFSDTKKMPKIPGSSTRKNHSKDLPTWKLYGLAYQVDLRLPTDPFPALIHRTCATPIPDLVHEYFGHFHHYVSLWVQLCAWKTIAGKIHGAFGFGAPDLRKCGHFQNDQCPIDQLGTEINWVFWNLFTE
jgi:hypothetical protein